MEPQVENGSGLPHVAQLPHPRTGILRGIRAQAPARPQGLRDVRTNEPVSPTAHRTITGCAHQNIRGHPGAVSQHNSSRLKVIKAVESGRMVATIAQQTGELGAKAVEQAAKRAKGEPVEAEVPVEVVTVTKDNVANFK